MAFINYSHLEPRQHIQDHHVDNQYRHYWGYASRVVPCKNDKGSCEYLDSVYWMHEVSMLYTFIMWAVIGSMLVLIILSRLLRPRRRLEICPSDRCLGSENRHFFPYTTRFQVVVLAILCFYLTIFSSIGIIYKTWVTPIKNSDKFNTRTGLGGFSDRVGALAYALTPLTIALCSRDSVLSLLTGVPYQHFNFLHRWTGRIILIQSFIHTIGWTIVESKLYQPQPKVYNTFIKQTYMIWGIVAQSFITFLFVFSLRPVIRWTGYEFFRKSHFLVAALYLGACWGNWDRLSCWMIASLGILVIDMALRILRVCLIHFECKNGNKGFGFRAIQSKLESYQDPSGTIVRVSFTHDHQPWKVGQHFYVTFPSLSIWQSHPFTPASVPSKIAGPMTHTYIVRARSGETGKLAALAELQSGQNDTRPTTIPVILLGPYGGLVLDDEASNVLAIAGGTGISFTLPVIASALQDPRSRHNNVEMIWIVRHIDNLAWIAPELLLLKNQLAQSPASPVVGDRKSVGIATVRSSQGKACFRIRIFVTRSPETRTRIRLREEKDLEVSSASSSNSIPTHSQEIQDLLKPHPDFSVTYLKHEYPCMDSIIGFFMNNTVFRGRTQVIASGPAQLGTDIRAAVAERSSAGKVWRGDERADITCVWDNRMG